MKTSLKIILLLLCFVSLSCGKRKKEKECVGIGKLENIEDSVFFSSQYNSAISEVINFANVNKDTSLIDKVDAFNPHIALITKESTFNQFVNKIKSVAPNVDIMRIQKAKPDFSKNSLFVVTQINMPSFASGRNTFYSLSFKLSVDDIDKFTTVTYTYVANFNDNKTQYISAFLITKKTDPLYKLNLEDDNIRCHYRIINLP